jgi:hypothetical protein
MSKPLKLQSHKFIRLRFDQDLRRSMRELWLRKRIITENPKELEEYYYAAFSTYLERNKIPKQIRRRTRTQAKILASEGTISFLKSMKFISRSRQQPLASVIEESLEQFLDLPQNYMGMDKKRK